MNQIWSLIIVMIMFWGSSCFAQNRNNIWCFGDSSGIDFGTVANPTTFRSSVVSRGSCVSIADTNGYLLFYAHTRSGVSISGNSTLIFDSTHQLMPNGANVKGESWYNEVLIIPDPGTNNEYFLFTKGMSTSPGFAYSKIDMNLNGGLGDVSQKNVILNNVRNADCLTGIKHGNGHDWWVISKYSNLNLPNFNRFYVFLITNNTVHPPIIQDLNNAGDFDFHQLVFNSDGTRLMQTNRQGLMQEIAFDRCTGLLSNPVVYFPEQLSGNHNRNYWASAYSPDNSKFYTIINNGSDTTRLIQYDLSAVDVATSADTLMEEIFPPILGALRLAPDGKIYVSSWHVFNFPGYPYPDTAYSQVNTNLSVINMPDSAGFACDFQPYSFYLGGSRTYAGLPNNPNYDLGPLVGSGCDTITAISETHSEPAINLYVYHDSMWEIAFVNAKILKGKTGILICYDIQGREIFKEPLQTTNGYYTKDLATHSFSPGIYMVQLITDKEKLCQKFVVD
ncbi:MAG: T9SS type A sorting domain-containing protein [Bacteroidia bacterium]|nr:T9SS type A sorting domain-containing protein [Bacteroidia bacterium]